ncbi:chemotaxis protein CheB [Aeoliella mucimassa]|uniref:histidine kinase n=1 Tax=Aeoliella mucimassa TaxID=2527972 RepID=A0A518AS88_9BACT|nr:chemotaxis protein CheB [Aeoliella mucimassa]QDU57588.1 Autoinducer 2 sensor kinase/phosphatase LuxQ [Aeoliella mucimassa]
MTEGDRQMPEPTHVVGIGASAGGLEAIQGIFQNMPINTGMSFVVVQHLSPDFNSLMREVLSRWTSLPVLEAESGMRLAANIIYLMPPKSEIVVVESCLLLKERDPQAPFSLPIDHFFRSLAQDLGGRSIAVVLSGTGSDGSRGVVDIHTAGGLVIAQNEETAKFFGMPRSAIETGVVDFALAPEDIPLAIEQYAADPPIADITDSLHAATSEQPNLQHILTRLRDAYGLDFGYYKLSTVVRRVERRMLMQELTHIADYIAHIDSHPDELELLYRDLLIGVTTFFRDRHAYEQLATKGIRSLIDNAEENSEVRVWVAGCATGEEAYSLAILFKEQLALYEKQVRIRLFATDVNQEFLDTASAGIYSEESLSEVIPSRIELYFRRDARGFRVSPELRESIVFARHNLTKDPPFTKIDLISCRNLLIYLQPHIQTKILSLFHFGLRTNGLLFLGASESTSELSDEFETLDTHWKLYEKKRDVRIAADKRWRSMTPNRSTQPNGLPSVSNKTTPFNDPLLLSTYDVLLESVMPPSLLISEEGSLLHTFGDAGKYLQTEHGRTTIDVYQRLVGDLRISVAAAVRKALNSESQVTYTGVAVDQSDSQELLDISALPIRDNRRGVHGVLVQFQPSHAAQHSPSPATLRSDNLSAEQVLALETELRFTKENLQATIEELESSNEELQAANEELVASNEELQSTNEELHSVNEELYTVNAEHQSKITELSELTRDMDNLLHSTEVHTVFLDSEMRIRKFTPKVADTFSFLPQDVGRRIDTFSHSIEVAELADRIEHVICTGEPFEQEVRIRDNGWFLLRILPYLDPEDVTTTRRSVLLTLVDITSLRQALEELEQSVKQRDRFLAMLSHELRNPLSTILNATHVLCSSNDDSSNEHAAKVIQRQSTHMSTLLDDLLDVSRVSQGKIQLQKHPFELQHAVKVAVEAVTTRYQKRRQQIHTHLPTSSVWIHGSEPRILQVITNLLTNASKYSPYDSFIDLSMETEDNEVIVSVRDHGVGIAKEHLEKVFELFEQADRTLDRADGGLGVGLTLVKSLVGLHGGSVAVTSDGEGKGSVFSFRLPTCEPDESAEVNECEPPTNAGIQKIVLVEDSVDASRMLAFLLEDAGFEVSTAPNGEQGLELIKQNQPEAAIIDIGLPGLSGYDVAKRLRADSSHHQPFLVALTGYGQPADRTNALSAGFDEHLVKPVDPDLLTRILGGRPT